MNQYRWYSNPPQNYIYTIIARRKVPLHTFLLNSNSDSPIDHINRLKTDNRKSNLRYANKQGNSANMGLSRRNKTGAKGVDLLPGGKFKARIGFNNRKVELGTFNTFAEAATAYDNAAQLYFGDFACTNAMLEKEAKRLEAVASE